MREGGRSIEYFRILFDVWMWTVVLTLSTFTHLNVKFLVQYNFMMTYTVTTSLQTILYTYLNHLNIVVSEVRNGPLQSLRV